MTRLEQLRLDAHMSRAQLAIRTGVPERTIRELESGNVRKPRIETVAPLAEHFAITASDLVTDFASVHDDQEAA